MGFSFCSKIAMKPLLLLATLFFLSFLLLRLPSSPRHLISSSFPAPLPPPLPEPTTLRHIVFGIASSALSWPRRSHFVRLWWSPNLSRGYVFLDRLPTLADASADPLHGPPLRVSADASRFPYTFPRGFRSAVRVARIVSEVVDALRGEEEDVRWIVLGDDDTVFVPHNLAKVLSKYDHRQWYYVGSNSESVNQNSKYSFDMAFGGGGFALSYPLAMALARVLDSCLVRYSHLYGSDARIYSCLVELGVGLTRESGFHQVDIRGDLFGMLSAHPLSPLVSLHHLDNMEPIFPKMNRTQALERLFTAIMVDPGRILQQSVCYDRSKLITISVSWGYSIQVYEGNILLPDLLALQRTFTPWKRSRNFSSSQYMFNTRDFSRDPCTRPATFFLENVFSDSSHIKSNYNRYIVKSCTRSNSLAYGLETVRVHSQKEELDIPQLQAPRRQCCDVLSFPYGRIMEIQLRGCKDEELISMS